MPSLAQVPFANSKAFVIAMCRVGYCHASPMNLQLGQDQRYGCPVTISRRVIQFHSASFQEAALVFGLGRYWKQCPS